MKTYKQIDLEDEAMNDAKNNLLGEQYPNELKFDKHGVRNEVYYGENGGVKVTCLQAPTPDYKKLVYMMVKATWIDKPITVDELLKTPDHVIDQVFMQVLKGEALPNSMEALVFTFLIEGIPLPEVTHLLRHRMFFSIHAQCTADRDLRDDSFIIPPSIEQNPKFLAEYRRLTKEANILYEAMVDSKKVSYLDARYILPRNNRYFYYVSMNLKDAIAFIKQRRCTMIQPYIDNQMARQIYAIITQKIPELKEVLSTDCDMSCHYVRGINEMTTQLYEPDEVHKKLLEKAGIKRGHIYNKTRREMNGGKN
jgi:thymidylate synthase (FAD)